MSLLRIAYINNEILCADNLQVRLNGLVELTVFTDVEDLLQYPLEKLNVDAVIMCGQLVHPKIASGVINITGKKIKVILLRIYVKLLTIVWVKI